MKDKKHLYNPLESASFRQSQLATALAKHVAFCLMIAICRILFSVCFDSYFDRLGCVGIMMA